ncbi:MAG: NAD(P)/FAD-dependent oxidoreductase [bacterium]
MQTRQKIAVIGSGISGTVSAWLLRNRADITLFEADTRFGGHTHTYIVDDHRGTAVDTGFMVFNRENYPLLGALFDHLGIQSYPTEMSFSTSFDDGKMEWAGSDLNTLFGQRKNLVSPAFWNLLSSVLRFNRLAQKAVSAMPPAELSLGAFLDQHRFNHAFRSQYLYPMAAAIWSCPADEIALFPACSFLRFFANHGLIQIADRPQWLTVDGGSNRYLDKLIADLGPSARSNTPVARLQRTAEGVEVIEQNGARQQFDAVVIACHSDQALRLLADPTIDEQRLLGAIPYQSNRVLLHRDPALMPQTRRVWSSWNYSSRSSGEQPGSVSVTYWMNSLQRLNTQTNYFVSLNPLDEPRQETIVAEFEYDHPVFNAAGLAAQKQLHRIQGRANTWFAGAWTGYGFHEDGMRSGVEVAQALGASLPWEERHLHESRKLTLVPQLVGTPA